MPAGTGGAAAPPRRLLDWKSVVGILISAAAIYLTARSMDLRAVGVHLREADLLLLILSAIATTGVFWIRAWRWKAILEPVEIVPFKPRFAAVTIGFMGNNLLPARLGEFMRAFALSRMTPVPIVASFASLVIERLFDGVLVIALLFVAMSLPSFPPFSGTQQFELLNLGTVSIAGLARGAGIFIGAAVFLLFALVLFPRRAVQLLESLVRVLPARVRRPIIDALEAFLAGVSMLRSPRLLLRTSAWSIVLWVFNAVGCWIGFRAFGYELPFVAALFFQSAVALAVSIPSAPGFVGVYHAMATFVLSTLWDQPPESALAFAVGFHLAGFIPVTLIGLYYAWRTGLSLRDVTASEDVVETAVEEHAGIDENGNVRRRHPDDTGPVP